MSTYNYNNKNSQGGNDWISWAVIGVLMFSGAWFVAVPWLLFKLFGPDKAKSQRKEAPPLNYNYSQYRTNVSAQTGAKKTSGYSAEYTAPQQQSRVKNAAVSLSQSPQVDRKTAILLFGIGTFLVLCGVGLIGEASGFAGVMSSLGFLFGGAAMIAGGVSNARAAKRYKQYRAMVGNTQAVSIEQLAKKSGLKEDRVRRDLEKMIDKGLFGDTAYINKELGFLFLSSEADRNMNQYVEAARKKEAAAKKADADKAAAEASSEHERIIHQIRDVNDRIAHPVMSQKIFRIEAVTREIFRTVEAEPEKKAKIDRFLSYYLPTTLKLLESYAQFEAAGVSGDNISQSMQSIEQAMDSIVAGFENQLDELYKMDALNIETDIDVMQKMMGRTRPKDDFQIPTEVEIPAAPDPRSQFEKDFNLSHGSGTQTVPYGGSAAQTAPEEEGKG